MDWVCRLPSLECRPKLWKKSVLKEGREFCVTVGFCLDPLSYCEAIVQLDLSCVPPVPWASMRSLLARP